MRQTKTIPTSSACGRHSDRVAATHCDDCAMPLCEPCAVDVPDVGTFCWSCASRRGGLNHRPRKLYAAPDPPEEPPLLELPVDSGIAVEQFEAMVADRAPHPLISGLTERLEEAGADPEDVVDDDELMEEIERLQDIATEEPTPRRRWFHRD